MVVQQRSKDGVLRRVTIEANEDELRELILHVFAAIDEGHAMYRLDGLTKLWIVKTER